MKECWTGLVAQLPQNAPPPAELYGMPELTWSHDGRVAQIELRGLVDHRGWIMLFTQLLDVHLAEGVEELVLTISVRAAVARGSLVAMMTLERLGNRIRTTARMLDCCGAAFVLAKLCDTVTTTPGRFRTGLNNSLWLYGDGHEPFPAEDVRQLLSSIAYCEGESVESRAARAVSAGKLTEERAEDVLALMNQIDTPAVVH